MKVVLFCGGQGMRIREHSGAIPKPMVTIGYRPILWHLMRYYAFYGHTDFILCLGYQGDVIKRYFMEYREWMSNDFVLSNGGQSVECFSRDIEDWRITFVDTGRLANVGQRLMAVRPHLEDEEVFLANYADVLTDLPLPILLRHFEEHENIVTFVAVRPSQTFHVVDINGGGAVERLRLASRADLWVNGGFFVLNRKIFDYMQADDELVDQPFQRLIECGRLTAYRHEGFWVGMDTFKEWQQLEDLYTQGRAPWALWDDGRRPASPMRWPGRGRLQTVLEPWVPEIGSPEDRIG